MTEQERELWTRLRPHLEMYDKAQIWVGGTGARWALNDMHQLLGLGKIDMSCLNCVKAAADAVVKRWRLIKEEL